MTRQKKLQLSGTIYRFLIKPSPVGEGGSRRLTDEVFFCKRNFSYREVCAEFFRLPCAKGAVGASRLRDCFYNPSRRGLQACSAYLQIPPTAARFPNPSRRRLQEHCVHLQIPYTGEAHFNQPAPQAHLFSSIFSLIFSLRSVVCYVHKKFGKFVL